MIKTERLQLIPGSKELLRAALDGSQALGAVLGALVPESWPPEFLDSAALQFTLDRYSERAEDARWWMYFLVLPGAQNQRTLIGSAGYKGPPTADGMVEVGYGIVGDQRRRGYATEATLGLLRNAFADPVVSRVIAETLPELTGSIGVLRKCGFHQKGEGSEPGVIRFQIERSEFSAPCVVPVRR
jgi:RimJ/RimL family protein N-acetyltransferase